MWGSSFSAASAFSRLASTSLSIYCSRPNSTQPQRFVRLNPEAHGRPELCTYTVTSHLESMHQTLQNPDIVLAIVKFAYTCNTPWEEDHSPTVDNGRVLAFALTCHAFLEPALDVLWSCQRSLMPLLSCFSSKVIRKGEQRYSETEHVRRRW